MSNKRNKTAKELERIELERNREDATKKLFKQLHKNYTTYLFIKVKDIKQRIETDSEPISDSDHLEQYLLQQRKRDAIITSIINELHDIYYNDNNYYCNNEEFYNLQLKYQLEYKKILHKVINALF